MRSQQRVNNPVNPKKRNKRKPRETPALNYGQIIDIVQGKEGVDGDRAIAEHIRSLIRKGNQRAIINLAQLAQLAEHHWTIDEIAAFFRVSEKTIDVLLKQAQVSDLYTQGKARGRGMLRSAQFKAAIKGNVTAQIWLGKNLLGQRDSFEVSGPNGSQLQGNNTYITLDYFRLMAAVADGKLPISVLDRKKDEEQKQIDAA